MLTALGLLSISTIRHGPSMSPDDQVVAKLKQDGQKSEQNYKNRNSIQDKREINVPLSSENTTRL